MKKKNIVIIIIVLIVIALFGKALLGKDDTNDNLYSTDDGGGDFKVYLDNISSGGPPKDGIPPIDNPIYIDVNVASEYLENNDKVFVYEALEETYIYPQRILVWHEIVNDNIDGENISITYCPLTGSTIAFLGKIDTYDNNTYGTSGKLLNSNLVMYDRATDSYIPQILGIGINSSLAGLELESNPIHWSSWEDAKTLFPDAKILSTDTGFIRDYNNDPYGSYDSDDENSYYFSDGTLFPLINENDGTFRDKKVVVGVILFDDTIALDPFLIRDKSVFNFEIGSTKAVAFYDNNLKAVRVFNSNVAGETRTFEYKNQEITDEFGIVWSEKGISSDDNALEPMNYFDVMWFAWHAFFPDTEVIK